MSIIEHIDYDLLRASLVTGVYCEVVNGGASLCRTIAPLSSSHQQSQHRWVVVSSERSTMAPDFDDNASNYVLWLLVICAMSKRSMANEMRNVAIVHLGDMISSPIMTMRILMRDIRFLQIVIARWADAACQHDAAYADAHMTREVAAVDGDAYFVACVNGISTKSWQTGKWF